jgi:hypothetical protein
MKKQLLFSLLCLTYNFFAIGFNFYFSPSTSGQKEASEWCASLTAVCERNPQVCKDLKQLKERTERRFAGFKPKSDMKAAYPELVRDFYAGAMSLEEVLRKADEVLGDGRNLLALLEEEIQDMRALMAKHPEAARVIDSIFKSLLGDLSTAVPLAKNGSPAKKAESQRLGALMLLKLQTCASCSEELLKKY